MDPETSTRLAFSRSGTAYSGGTEWPEQSSQWRGGRSGGQGEAVRGLRPACAGPPACFNWKVEPEEENQEK